MAKLSFERLENRAKIHLLNSSMNYFLECFGDTLAEEREYADIDGMEAVHHYLVLKHNWLPGQVKDLCPLVIRELLNEELQGYKLSSDETKALHSALETHKA